MESKDAFGKRETYIGETIHIVASMRGGGRPAYDPAEEGEESRGLELPCRQKNW